MCLGCYDCRIGGELPLLGDGEFLECCCSIQAVSYFIFLGLFKSGNVSSLLLIYYIIILGGLLIKKFAVNNDNA